MTHLTTDQRREIQSMAEALLGRYSRFLDVFSLLRRIAEDHGLEVLEADLYDMSGALRREDGRWRIYINRQDSPARQLFTLAHELGHFFLHRDERAEFVDGEFVMNRDEGSKFDKEEMEANEFAGNLIMPAGRIEERLRGKSLTDKGVLTLADAFRVSPLAMAIRLRTLGYDVPPSPPARA